MPKTRFERLEITGQDIAAFRVSGKLGFHENVKVEHLVEECKRREFSTVIFDFSELSSLGGGVARILRGFIGDQKDKGREVRFVITNDIVLDFLKDDDTEIQVYSTMEEAGALEVAPAAAGEDSGEIDEPAATIETPESEGPGDVESDPSEPELSEPEIPEPESSESETSRPEEAVEAMEEGQVEAKAEKVQPAENDAPGVIHMSYDGGAEEQPEAETAEAAESGPDVSVSDGGDQGAKDSGIISAIFDESNGDDAAAVKKVDVETREEPPAEKVAAEVDVTVKMKRRLLELKTLLSISADFNAIRDKKSLLDIFLLTSIAQGGVESAVFFERVEGTYLPTMMKGLDESEVGPIFMTPEDEKQIAGTREVNSVKAMQFGDQTVAVIEKAGLEFFCPFMTSEGLAGLVFLGKRITGRGMKKEDFEFMKIMVNVASGAYQNAMMTEREHERTLGIVKSLISLIEENTMLTGTSEFVSRYVGMVAKNMEYPEESFKDLVYGTVLRDMGMIKVSDLILRSPRELSKEEWNIINRHPEDGADMLKRMKFNSHVVDIVLSHHERFNGEGYPRGLRGKEIPLGSRIISVVESYSAMIHERPNRPALSSKEALETLKENYGLRYDREVVRQFVKIMEKEMAKSVRPGVTVS